MKHNITLFILFFSGILKGYSCQCGNNGIQYEINNSDLIFNGIPVDKQEVDYKVKYTFTVNKIWQGEQKDSVILITGIGGPDCGMIFEIGKEYLVFSRGGETNRCRRNALVTQTFDIVKLDCKFSPEIKRKCFTDSSIILNRYESKYLNKQFKSSIKDFDFTDKKIIFTSNIAVIDKLEWYNRFWNYDEPSIQLIKLTDTEKNDTGYDAILATFSKRLIRNKQKKKIIEQIKY